MLRHGLTAHNAAGIWQGHLDSPLNEAGMAQARKVAPVIAQYEPAVLFSSDLRRARDTASAVHDALPHLEVRVDPRYREIDVGQWQGLTTDEMLERFPEAPDQLATGEDFRRGGDGETFAELGTRALAATTDLLHDLPDGATAVVVTHGVTARALTGGLLGLDRATAWTTLSGLGNCHWAELGLYGGQWRLHGWNLRAQFGARPPAG